MLLDFGVISGNEDFIKQPVGTRLVINSGEFKTGPSSHNAVTRVPSTILNDSASEIKELLESISGVEVMRLEVAGVIYGKDSRSSSSRGAGFHFPR